MAMEESAGSFSNKLSVDNSVQAQLQGTGQVYSEEGDFEIKEYSGTIRTNDLDDACATIETLRGVEGVIFENANKNEDSCYYSFKILKMDEAQALAIIDSLEPDTFNARVYTIKKVIENYDTELSILESKLESIETSLADAEREYTQLQTLATNARDVENLTKIIDSRLNFITKFTNERMSIIERINRYNKNKSDQLERLLYSYFNINVYEDKIVDFDAIKDSWKWELERFVSNISSTLQDISLGLATFLMRALQVAIYFFVGLFILKFAWVGAKKVWRGSFKSAQRRDDADQGQNGSENTQQ
jgi:hypothetical protein